MSQSDVIRLDLPASHKVLNVLAACLAAVLERVEGLPDPARTTYDVSLAAHEVCTNVIDHAYAGQAGGRIGITLTLEQPLRRLVIEVCDAGRAFDPSQVPEPDFESGQVHGYGLFLVQQLVDQATYKSLPDGNCWRLVKNL